MIATFELSAEQELLALTTTEGVVTNESFKDCCVVESVIHFATEQLKRRCVAGIIVLGSCASTVGNVRAYPACINVCHCN